MFRQVQEAERWCRTELSTKQLRPLRAARPGPRYREPPDAGLLGTPGTATLTTTTRSPVSGLSPLGIALQAWICCWPSRPGGASTGAQSLPRRTTRRRKLRSRRVPRCQLPRRPTRSRCSTTQRPTGSTRPAPSPQPHRWSAYGCTVGRFMPAEAPRSVPSEDAGAVHIVQRPRTKRIGPRIAHRMAAGLCAWAVVVG